jgi:hypothetical protein
MIEAIFYELNSFSDANEGKDTHNNSKDLDGDSCFEKLLTQIQIRVMLLSSESTQSKKSAESVCVLARYERILYRHMLCLKS